MSAKKTSLSILLFIISIFNINAQLDTLALDSVFIETYYVGNSVDETAGLPNNAVTYRVYLDLKEGYRLKRIFGDENHPFFITSDSNFYNHALGQSKASDINSVFFAIPSFTLLPLDSWLTINYATSASPGLPKSYDSDGALTSFVSNPDGTLQNNNSGMGIPLTTSDGIYSTFNGSLEGIFIAEENSNIENTLGAASQSNEYSSNNFTLASALAGTFDGLTNDNIILIAQLTTNGGINNFQFNIEVEDEKGKSHVIVGDRELGFKEKYSPWLEYPFNTKVGCPDPYRVGYDPNLVFYDESACGDTIVYGCLDKKACNYNATANTHYQDMCCYNADCELDVTLACPDEIIGCMQSGAFNFDPNATWEPEGYCCFKGGCTNPNFVEYDSTACFDNGSCLIPAITGCMDKTADNYNPTANVNDEDACCYGVGGCTSNLYLEYDANACFDDGSCEVLRIRGCIDKNNCNYNPIANVHDTELCFNQEQCDSANAVVRDINEQIGFSSNIDNINLYPNPVNTSTISLSVLSANNDFIQYEVVDIFGSTWLNGELNNKANIIKEKIDIESLPTGLFMLRININNELKVKPFIKN